MKNLIYLIFLGLSSVCYSNTIYIPGDASSIQEGIDIAADGDTIIVAPGEYFENINFNGKAIFLSSHYYYDQDPSYITGTIINGSSASASVVKFISGEDTTSVLNGFTVTGGTGTISPPGFSNIAGGGIIIIGGAKITNNHIINNNITGGFSWISGGGIYINTGGYGNVIIKNNLIADNSISGYEVIQGGGIYYEGSGNVIITNNTIKNNAVEAVNPIDWKSGGGGVCIFCIYYSSPLLYKNVIVENTAPYGAGIKNLGIYDGYNSRLINNTIASNNASIKGGGAYMSNGHCTAINNIFWDNSAPDDPNIFYRGEINISYSITQEFFPGDGNMQTDPLFENSEYHLSNVSPAIDAGNPNIEFNDIADPDNPTQPLWPAQGSLTADMGAFGGNDTVSIDIEDYTIQENFLYEEFNEMPYRFAYPLNYNVTIEYPLTIVLHGSGQHGTDNEMQLVEGLAWRVNAEYHAYNEFTIVPQAPTSDGWYNVNHLNTVYNIIRNTIENFPIDTTKITVTGWSLGAGGSWLLINIYPQFFSAAIPLCGQYFGCDEIKHVPVWVHHGSEDVNVSVSNSQHYISDFENTGLTAVYTEDSTDNQISDAIADNLRLFYSEYEGAAHFILNHAYEKHFLFDWLQMRSRPLIHPVNSDVSIFNDDSLLFITSYDNPNNSEFEHALIVEDLSQNRIDSLDLFDDGEHGDGLSQDGIWGNYIEILPEITEYRVGIFVKNLFNDKEFYFHDLDTISIIVGIDEEKLFTDKSFMLLRNYPNPFNHVTTISYYLTKACNVKLSVYNLLGQKIVDLVSEKQAPGIYTTDWDATNLQNGIYICTLKINSHKQNCKMFKAP